ncbi:MAG: thioredoxin reductase [Lewinellaceae bacterium]|nr:thioredoxin reductase [Lewinellaceae bacterium]
MTTTETLIVGYGFSVIPLIRELKREGRDYLVISDGKSVWEELDENGRLDFDLVSSKHTSLYSFELVEQDTKDEYLTARQFMEFQRKYKEQYGADVIKDRVTEIENYPTHSIVHTRSGEVYQAAHLVIATGFRRKVTQAINTFDFDAAQGKTVVLAASGDSANLMISKLIPRKARIVVLTNGIAALDKMVFYKNQTYTVDQLEMHNVRYISKLFFLVLSLANILIEFILPQRLVKLLSGHDLNLKFPLISLKKTRIPAYERKVKSAFPNGMHVLKYWPIDTYQRLFDRGHLEEKIREGYLLNDIAFFIDEGLVELWHKKETTIDHEARAIRWGEKELEFDYLIEGDRERPALPDIMIGHSDGGLPYQYDYRNNFMGIVPPELHNVYMIGYTRPFTGGLANIIEMQGLFVHKMITESLFREKTYENLEEKIEKYNLAYYGAETHWPTDHIVYFGFYTEDLAQLMGIAPTLSDCRSFKEVFQYFLFPNNAFKYRQEGPYKVEGVEEMTEKIWAQHNGFSLLKHHILNLLLTFVMALALILFLPLPAYLIVLLCLLQLANPLLLLLFIYGSNIQSYLNILYLCGLTAAVYFQNAWIPAITFLIAFFAVYIGGKSGWARFPYNDLRNKWRYREFFQRYLAAYNRVYSKEQVPSH